jgi:hypothetical protein
MLVVGTRPKICFACGMTSFPYERKIRILDDPKFTEPFRRRNFRKEDRVKKEHRVKELQHPGEVMSISLTEVSF